MKCVVLFLPALFLWLIPLAQADWNSLLDQGDGHLIYFGTALEGRSPFRRNADSSMAPASTMKLFTAGAILEKFGTDYRFPTELSWLETGRGQVAQLSLFGYGDPSLGMPEIGEKLRDRFDQFANALANAGVKEVLGLPQAEAGDPRWNALSLPDGWKETDTSSCGGAFGLAFNLGLNCGTLTIHSPSRATWSEEGLNFPVSLRIRESTNTNLEIKFNSAPISFIVEGSWRPGTSPQTFHLPIYDTNSWAANLLRNALISRGIRILPKQDHGEEAGVKRSLVFLSPPLSELVKPFLKNSINFLGDAFLKQLGTTESGSLRSDGLRQLENHLRLSLGDIHNLSLHDGSGLSRTARVSPELLLQYLAALTRKPYFRTIYAALPIAGIDGTLKNRMKGSPAEGTLRAKTGTLDGVYNLAGYVPDGKDFIPFVILTRTTSALASAARAAEDRIGAEMARIHHSSSMENERPYPYYPEHAGLDGI